MKARRAASLALLAVLVVGAAAIWRWNVAPARNAQDLVRAQLKDPDAAQFRNVTVHPHGIVCGEVNARNSMGGYTGFRAFVTSERGVAIVAPDDREPAAIREAFRLEFEAACRN